MVHFRSVFTPFFLFFACSLPCCFAETPATIGEISPIEAAHLVEFQINKLITTNIQTTRHNDIPVYIVEGKKNGDGYQAVVDAQIARVLSVTRNGEAFYKWPGIISVGHRGCVKFTPENTIAAFNKAIELGADLLEMDVRETKDGYLVIMHDSTLNRTTNGSGKVSDRTLAEIKQLDAGSWFGPEFKGEPVPTFEEVLAAIRGRALPDIDFKAGTPEKLVEALKKEDLLGKVTMYCGNWDLMHATLELTEGIFARPTVPFGRVGLPLLLDRFDPPIVNMDWPDYSEGLVRDCHLAGKKAFVNVLRENDTQFGMLSAINAGA
ncbi:MAG: glycerophosphodiester phosphodiesterase family protein, partial [bacterium]